MKSHMDKWRARNKLDPKTNRKPFAFYTEGHSMTKQEFKDDCDVNLILKKYEKTNVLRHVSDIQGSYGDFTSASDYHTSINQVMDAQDRFMGLPAAVRSRFQNDPGQLIDFVQDQKNYDEAVKLGLISPEKAKAYSDSKKPKVQEPVQVAPEKPKNDDKTTKQA